MLKSGETGERKKKHKELLIMSTPRTNTKSEEHIFF